MASRLLFSLFGSSTLNYRAVAGTCSEHATLSECIVFRNQHSCAWDALSQSCVPDTPCEQRSKTNCERELTTGGDSETWDATQNKCFWDYNHDSCRWADECTTLTSHDDCTSSSCSWQKVCTPTDMAHHPGPGVCREVCALPLQIIPEETGRWKTSRQHATVTGPKSNMELTLTGVIETTNGPVQGIHQGGVQAFLGIPFAQAPVGALRWAPPQPLSKWNSLFSASSYGPSCSQARGYYFANSRCQGYTREGCYGYTEDCLNLNIWTPNTSGSRAVMVWIHGGCFVSGSASNPEYNGSSLAANQDVVVISVQYRLGVFGFLGDSRLRPRAPSGTTGNYGLMDNVAALRWIHENIAAFGGDPGRVTIFGESSGAGSVSQLLGVEDAWPYFHRGIMESGTGSFWTYMTAEAASQNFAQVLTATSCGEASDVVQCLLQAPAGSVASGVADVPCRDGCTWAPLLDGVYVRGTMLEIARARKLRPDTPIISGFNLNDGAMFVPGYPFAMSSMTSASLGDYFSKRFGEQNARTLKETFPVPDSTMPSWESRYFFAAQECETDFSYSCMALWVSTAIAEYGGSAYVYQFAEPTSNGLVLHGDEIGYVFGTLADPSSQQGNVSGMMMQYWANFAKTGNPDSTGLPRWPSWKTSGSLLQLSSSPVVLHHPNNSWPGCSFFAANWDYYALCLPPDAVNSTTSIDSPAIVV